MPNYVDVTILVDLEKEQELIRKIFSFFQPRIASAFEFALKSRGDYEIDISLGIPGYEEKLLQIAKKIKVRICSAKGSLYS